MQDDYSELREQLQKVNLSDPKSLKRWFDSHDYLTVNDHAIIMGRCTKTVRKLRKRAGILGERPKTTVKPVPKRSPIVYLPPDWRNSKWLSENIKRYGSDAIIRATGLTKKAFYSILRRLNVPYSGKFESKNPLCNKAWCYRHYVELNYSLTKCARIAGTNHNTISNWLVKFGIPLRQKGIKIKRSKKKSVPLLFRKLFNQLDKHPMVTRIKMFNKRINVSFKDGIERYYNLAHINADQFECEQIPKIYHEYGYDINGTPHYPAHVGISRKQLRSSTIFESDIAMHEFNNVLGERGWIDPAHPQSAVMEEWRYLQSLKESTFISHKGYKSFTTQSIGMVYQNYFDLSHINSTLRHHSERWKLISLMRHAATPFNYDFLIRQLCRHRTGVRLKMINPAFYAALFRNIGVTKSVLDINMLSGARLFAACLVGCHYYTVDDCKLKYAESKGIRELGARYSLFDNEKVDLVIADNDFSECELDHIYKYFKYGRQVAAFVHHDNVEEYKSKLKPRAIIPFATQYYSKDNHYYFIW